MLSNYKPCLVLLSLLSAVALADPPNRDWQVSGLKAADTPIDATQTGPTPALHYIRFNVTDDTDLNTVFECSATWANADFPPPSTLCSYVEHSVRLNATFDYTVVSYDSAASGFQVRLEEIEQGFE